MKRRDRREQQIREDERRRIADVLDELAAMPDADPERVDMARGLARILRINTEELIITALMAMIEEIKAEDGATT